MIREDMRYDVRTVPHRLRRGELSPEEVQKHLDALPDDADQGETTDVQFVRSYEERQGKVSADAEQDGS